MKVIKAQSLTRFSTMTHCLLASLSLQLAILVDFCSSNFAIFAVSPIHFWQQFPLNLFSAKWTARKISSQIFARAFNPGNKCFKSTDRVIVAALGYKTETVVRAFSSNGAHDKSLEITCYNYISFLLNFFLKKKIEKDHSKHHNKWFLKRYTWLHHILYWQTDTAQQTACTKMNPHRNMPINRRATNNAAIPIM